MHPNDKHELMEIVHHLSRVDKVLIIWYARWRRVRRKAVNKFSFVGNFAIVKYLYRPSRSAHWVQSRPRAPRYERQMFWLLIITAIVMSRPETIQFNVLIGAALSFSFILYVLIRMLFSSEN